MQRRQTTAMTACTATFGALLVVTGAAAAEPEGVTLMTANCMQCHQVKGIENAGNIGPVLSDMKSRFPDRAALAAVIFDETKRNPLTVMPPFGRNLILTNQQIDTIIDFLYTR
jgi:L-cysteine S-thiosulfotransferase